MENTITVKVKPFNIYVIMGYEDYGDHGDKFVCRGYYTDREKAQKNCREFNHIADYGLSYWIEELSHISTYEED